MATRGKCLACAHPPHEHRHIDSWEIGCAKFSSDIITIVNLEKLMPLFEIFILKNISKSNWFS